MGAVLILMILFCSMHIECFFGFTLVSVGLEANYMDMVNYALFGLIKLSF